MHDELMTIGDLSQRTGVSVKTIRRYTDQGLVCTAGRSDADYRLYDDTAVSCINSIRTLRSLGLSLDDVARLHAFYGQEPRRPVGPWLLARLAEVRREAREQDVPAPAQDADTPEG